MVNIFTPIELPLMLKKPEFSDVFMDKVEVKHSAIIKILDATMDKQKNRLPDMLEKSQHAQAGNSVHFRGRQWMSHSAEITNTTIIGKLPMIESSCCDSHLDLLEHIQPRAKRLIDSKAPTGSSS